MQTALWSILTVISLLIHQKIVSEVYIYMQYSELLLLISALPEIRSSRVQD